MGKWIVREKIVNNVQFKIYTKIRFVFVFCIGFSNSLFLKKKKSCYTLHWRFWCCCCYYYLFSPLIFKIFPGFFVLCIMIFSSHFRTNELTTFTSCSRIRLTFHFKLRIIRIMKMYLYYMNIIQWKALGTNSKWYMSISFSLLFFCASCLLVGTCQSTFTLCLT